MSLFPSSPANGQQVTVNGILYTYDSTQTAWIRTSAGTSGNLIVSGNITVSGTTITSGLIANSTSQSYTSVAISGNTLTLDLSTATVFGVTLNSNITTVNLSNVSSSGKTASIVLQLTADGTARSVTWPTSFRWPGGTAPTLTSTLNKIDIITAYTDDGGTNWFAFISGQNL